MKTNLVLLTLGSIVLMSCVNTNITYTSPHSQDDLYYSKSDAERGVIYHEEVQVQNQSKENTTSYVEEPQVQNPAAVYEKQETIPSTSNESTNSNYSTSATGSYDNDGKTIINNNYYGDVYEDDDQGYYSTRIRRFHQPYQTFNYYSPAYCGFYYDPFYSPGWNFSIGVGYSYGFGYYDPFFNPFYNPWYSSYYSPYYGYGGWGGYDSYRWGYRDGYWDGRNDNGYYGGGYYGGGSRGGSKNTIVRGPRPTRGGSVSTAGGRVEPIRGTVPSDNGNTESIRSMPPTRTSPSNTNNASTTIRTNPIRESAPAINNSNNGYVPPRLPPNTKSESSPAVGTGTTPRSETIIRSNPNPQPVRINPNYGGSAPSTPRIRSDEPRSSEPVRTSEPRYSAPSRSSEPRNSAPSSPAPSRSSGSSSSPVSRPRPR